MSLPYATLEVEHNDRPQFFTFLFLHFIDLLYVDVKIPVQKNTYNTNKKAEELLAQLSVRK